MKSESRAPWGQHKVRSEKDLPGVYKQTPSHAPLGTNYDHPQILTSNPTVPPTGQLYFPPVSSDGSFLTSTEEGSNQTGSSITPVLSSSHSHFITASVPGPKDEAGPQLLFSLCCLSSFSVVTLLFQHKTTGNKMTSLIMKVNLNAQIHHSTGTFIAGLGANPRENWRPPKSRKDLKTEPFFIL